MTIVLSIKEIQLITGKSYNTAQRIYAAIKRQHGLTRALQPSVSQVAAYLKIPVQDVLLGLERK